MLRAQTVHRSPLVPLTLVAACLMGMVMVIGCGSNGKNAQNTGNPVKLAEIEARQQRAKELRSEAEQNRHAELAARKLAASLQAAARSERQSAARDQQTAALYRQEAAILERDGQTVVLAGERFVEMQDEQRGPRIIARGEAKLTSAKRLRSAAQALDFDAEVKLAKAGSLVSDAGAQLAKAQELRTKALRFQAALASMPLETLE